MSYSSVCNLISEIRKKGTVVLDTSCMKVITHESLGSCLITKEDGVEKTVKLCCI